MSTTPLLLCRIASQRIRDNHQPKWQDFYLSPRIITSPPFRAIKLKISNRIKKLRLFRLVFKQYAYLRNTDDITSITRTTSILNLICLYLVWCALAINRELKGSLQQHDIAVAAAT